MQKPVKMFSVNMAPFTGDDVKETLYSGQVTEGPMVTLFEEELAPSTAVRAPSRWL
jgi:hypothetical protein